MSFRMSKWWNERGREENHVCLLCGFAHLLGKLYKISPRASFEMTTYF